MTVKELIDRLSNLDQEATVVIEELDMHFNSMLFNVQYVEYIDVSEGSGNEDIEDHTEKSGDSDLLVLIS